MCPPSSLDPLLRQLPNPPSAADEPGQQIPDCVPKNTLCISAYELAAASLPAAILNHSVRVYIYAQALADKQQASLYATTQEQHRDLLFIACVLHDIGCASRFDGPERFEVEGADAAKARLLEAGRSEQDAHDVWVAIACHSSPHIAEKISQLSFLVRIGVVFDFKGTPRLPSGYGLFPDGDEPKEVLNERLRSEVELAFPRLEPEKVLGDAVVEQAKRKRDKAPPASWPGILLRAADEEPEWDGVNKAF